MATKVGMSVAKNEKTIEQLQDDVKSLIADNKALKEKLNKAIEENKALKEKLSEK